MVRYRNFSRISEIPTNDPEHCAHACSVEFSRSLLLRNFRVLPLKCFPPRAGPRLFKLNSSRFRVIAYPEHRGVRESASTSARRRKNDTLCEWYLRSYFRDSRQAISGACGRRLRCKQV